MKQVDEDIKTITSAFGAFTLSIAAIVLAACLNGWALLILWSWFVAPLFGTTALTLTQAMGFALVVHFLCAPRTLKKDERPALVQMGSALAVSVVHFLLAIGVGWIIHAFQ